ncbi:MAG: glycosyltransferase [Calothrix sp. MO_167.B12]|nr:glycosyltransferase [Calothrix sp. MO_167.B12]
MKVIQTLGFYFPQSSGGTEVYVDGLVNQRNSHNIKNIVAAPLSSDTEIAYKHNSVTVYRYPVFTESTLEQIRGVKPHGGFEYFARWLAEQKADIYHQHSWVTGCGIHHLRLAKELGMRTVITVHVPGNVCLRGTMLLNGEQVCDGQIDIVRCSNCWGTARQIPQWAAPIVSKVPQGLSKIAESSFSNSRLATVLATPALVASHKNRLLEMADLSDRVVAVCQWLYDALLLNGVPQEKLVLCRQGVDPTYQKAKLVVQDRNTEEPLKIGFLGRWDKIKGIHILVEAICQLPSDLPVELVIHGLVQGEEGEAYQQEVLARSGGDRRIKLAKPLSRKEVPDALAGFDLLAVPSQLLETGPLTVLEAQAVGTPVLGSNLGGIAELVQHGVNGWLVSPMDVTAWSEAIAYFARNRNILEKLRQAIAPVRTMKEVASEMGNLYQQLYNS